MNAQDIALLIASEVPTGYSSPEFTEYLLHVGLIKKDHLFQSKLEFCDYGITAHVVARNTKVVVGIQCTQKAEMLTKEVVAILTKRYGIDVAIKGK